MINIYWGGNGVAITCQKSQQGNTDYKQDVIVVMYDNHAYHSEGPQTEGRVEIEVECMRLFHATKLVNISEKITLAAVLPTRGE